MSTEPIPEHERLAQWLDKHPQFSSHDRVRWYVQAATHKDYTDTAALLRRQAARIAELEAERDALRADVRTWMKIADDEVNKDQAARIAELEAERNDYKEGAACEAYAADVNLSIIRSLRKRLAAEIRANRKFHRIGAPIAPEHAEELQRLSDEAVRRFHEDQQDAARYRWLRNGCNAKHSRASHIARHCYGMEWDAAIDKERATDSTNATTVA